MPNAPKTPIRGIRIEDTLWSAAKKRAAKDNQSVSDVVRAALQKYVAK